jgi:hypothetical protein
MYSNIQTLNDRNEVRGFLFLGCLALWNIGCKFDGPLAQLEEHLPYMQGVVGSIPTGTTKNDKVGSETCPKSEVKTRQNRKL